MMESSRRSFLKIAGLSAIGLGSRPVLDALAVSGGQGGVAEPQMLKNKAALEGRRWGMVIDTRKIQSSQDLEPMIAACHKFHNVLKLENKNHEIKWIWEEEFKHAFPTAVHEFLSEKVRTYALSGAL